MTEPSSTKRGPKPNPNTRSNLVQAGLRAIHEGGYAATGIQVIVDGADVPKASFYNYFDSKEAFGAEVIDAYFARSEATLRRFLCDKQVPPIERLEAYFDDRIEALRTMGFAKGCLLGNFSAEAVDHSALLRDRVAAQFGAWSRFFEDCVAQAQQQGAIGGQFSASALGRFLLNSWEGALLRMRAEKSDAALLEFKEIIFGGLLAAPGNAAGGD